MGEAARTFDAFPPSQKKEYFDWITGAKTCETRETRERRLEMAIEWLKEGKPRMWKYLKNK